MMWGKLFFAGRKIGRFARQCKFNSSVDGVRAEVRRSVVILLRNVVRMSVLSDHQFVEKESNFNESSVVVACRVVYL